jgi:flagellar hook assembly protein FlgD
MRHIAQRTQEATPITERQALPCRPTRLRCFAVATSAYLTIRVVSAGMQPEKSTTLLGPVSVSPTFFSPSLGQKETIHFSVALPSIVIVTILDRDGLAIRHLAPRKCAAGPVSVTWDGRDGEGVIVPDEAYTPRIEARAQDSHQVYDPTLHFVPQVEEVKIRYYSRNDGILSYTVPHPSRLHLQAGQSQPGAHIDAADGPVLKTIVDHEPRPAGSVIETWKGYDETGTIYVPGLPGFVVSALATTLAPTSILTVGNRTENFRTYARRHQTTGPSHPRMLNASTHRFHTGLNAFEDHSPQIDVKPTGGQWDPAKRLWRPTAECRLTISLSPEDAPSFLSQQPVLKVFLDKQLVHSITHGSNPTIVDLDRHKIPAGTHTVVVNWISPFGPLSASSLRLEIPESRAEPAASMQ